MYIIVQYSIGLLAKKQLSSHSIALSPARIKVDVDVTSKNCTEQRVPWVQLQRHPNKQQFADISFTTKGKKSSVADPNPYWIRVQSGKWIRIRIPNPYPDPKMTHKKVEKKTLEILCFEVLVSSFKS
jgi:hypothetical protein